MLKLRLDKICDHIECADGQALVGWSKARPSFHTPYTSLDVVNLMIMLKDDGGVCKAIRLPATADRDSFGEQRIFFDILDMVRVLTGRRRNLVLHSSRIRADEETENAVTIKKLVYGDSDDTFGDLQKDKLLLSALEEVLERPRCLVDFKAPTFYTLTRDITQLVTRDGGPLNMNKAVATDDRGSWAVPFSEASGKGVLVADIGELDQECAVMHPDQIQSTDPYIIINLGNKKEKEINNEMPKRHHRPLRNAHTSKYSSGYRRPGYSR